MTLHAGITGLISEAAQRYQGTHLDVEEAQKIIDSLENARFPIRAISEEPEKVRFVEDLTLIQTGIRSYELNLHRKSSQDVYWFAVDAMCFVPIETEKGTTEIGIENVHWQTPYAPSMNKPQQERIKEVFAAFNAIEHLLWVMTKEFNRVRTLPKQKKEKD